MPAGRHKGRLPLFLRGAGKAKGRRAKRVRRAGVGPREHKQMSTQDRDAAVERLLRQAMREDARPVGPCLDAGTLAAWSEDGLSGKALAAAEAHAASCVRCQAVLAAMARTSQVADGLDSRAARASNPWGISKGVRWLVPLAGAAAAGALVIAIWPGAGVEELGRAPAAAPISAPKQVAEPAPPAPSATLADKADAPAKAAPADTRATDAESGERRKVADEKAKNEKKELESARADAQFREQQRDGLIGPLPKKPESAASQSQSQELDQLKSRARALRQGEVQRTTQNAAAGQTQNANQIANQQAPAPMQNAPQSQTQVAPATPPAPAPARSEPLPPPAAPVAAGGAAVAGQAQKPGAVAESVLLKREAAIAAPALFATPDSSTTYRIVNGRDIQRSQDSGATWTTQTTVADVLSSGACVTTTACWVVGSGGSVFRTIDGRTWQRIPFAETADLVLVTASNADTVVVTAKDGRRFSTRDAGKSWVLEK